MWIVFEGSDCVGKSTISKRLADNMGFIHAGHPGATPIGAELRRLMKYSNIPIDKNTERVLMLADNCAFINTILIPGLEAGKTVVSDRCNFVSDYPYGVALGVDPHKLERLHSALECPKIDLLLVFTCQWETLKARMESKKENCRIESRGETYFKAVNNIYRQMLVPGTTYNTIISKHYKKIVEIDANKTMEEVYANVEAEITKVQNEKNS